MKTKKIFIGSLVLFLISFYSNLHAEISTGKIGSLTISKGSVSSKPFQTFGLNAVPLKSKSVFQNRLSDTTAIYFTPSNFNITADGKTDVSDALQDAINTLKTNRDCGIIFIPEGKYLITKTIYIPTAIRLIGYGKNRPVIVLGKNSPGYQKSDSTAKSQEKYMFWFVSSLSKPGDPVNDATAGTFYSAFSNIDIKIDDGNPNAIALRTHYAQHSFISHVDIHTDNGMAGIHQVGNEIEDVRFFGGDYGIIATKTSPGWQYVMVDTYFEGQRKAAIKTQEAGLTIVRMIAKNTPTVIDINRNSIEKLFMQDCQFDNISGAAVIVSNERNATNQISIRNVDCRKVPVFANFLQSGKQIKENGTIYKVKSCISGLQMDDPDSEPVNKTTQDIVEMKTFPAPVTTDIPELPATDTWVNIKTLGAKGDGETDDYQIIQDAITKYQTIYFPQGWYRVTETIKMKPTTNLIGLNPVSTQLMLLNNTHSFAGFGSPKALLEAPLGGTNILNGIGLNTNVDNPRAVGCKWMAGTHSYMNDVKFIGGHGSMGMSPKAKNNQVQDSSPRGKAGDENTWDSQYWSLWITNGGGGTFKDIWTASTFATSGVYISNTTTPGRIYCLSVEHHVRNEVRFNNVSNWKIYALQLEEEGRESWNCQPVEIDACSNLLFANLFTYRVTRVINPYPYAIRTRNCNNIEFLNLHNISQLKFAFDNSVYDMNTQREVRPREFTRLYINGNTSGANTIAGNEGKLQKLATGFEFANGLCHDSKGNIYFCDTRWRRIYKWSIETNSVSLVNDYPWEPLSLACDKNDNLLVVFKYTPKPGYPINGKPEPNTNPQDAGISYSGWGIASFGVLAYAVDPKKPDESIQLLETVPMGSVGNIYKALYPVYRLHYLPGTDIKNCYLAPDGVTIIPICNEMSRSCAMIEAYPGKSLFGIDDNEKRTVKLKVNPEGYVSDMEPFTDKGELGAIEGPDGKVYITNGEIYCYDKTGRQTDVLKVPERPTNITFGGKDGKTLFTTARSSLYSIQLK